MAACWLRRLLLGPAYFLLAPVVNAQKLDMLVVVQDPPVGEQILLYSDPSSLSQPIMYLPVGAVLYFPPADEASSPRTHIDEQHNMWVRVRVPNEHAALFDPSSIEGIFAKPRRSAADAFNNNGPADADTLQSSVGVETGAAVEATQHHDGWAMSRATVGILTRSLRTQTVLWNQAVSPNNIPLERWGGNTDGTDMYSCALVGIALVTFLRMLALPWLCQMFAGGVLKKYLIPAPPQSHLYTITSAELLQQQQAAAQQNVLMVNSGDRVPLLHRPPGVSCMR